MESGKNMKYEKHAKFHPVWTEEGAITVGNNLHT